uniref:Uncharacterized protein n=1 Tax=Trichobilharzia regenti TaxID=157069 RepID=A0AA85ITH6_TRIRE|nr:unnamed protein product [Trichobilharzia regenti]
MKLINLIVFLSLFTIFSATVQSDEVSEDEAPTGIWKMINIIKKAFRGACTMSQLLSWVIA